MRKGSKKQRRRGREQTMSSNGLQEAILGLLAIRPMSGYDLSHSYQRALQQIWYAPLGQVYPTLRKMRSRGLLKVSIQVQHDRPNRKVYSLTEAGRQMFVEWLSQPAALPRMHHEFIHKLFLLNHVDASGRIGLIDGYIERCNSWAAELRRVGEKLTAALDGPHGDSAWYQLLSLRHLCRIVECEAMSARQTAAEIGEKFNLRRKQRPEPRRKLHGNAAGQLAFGGLSLSPGLQANRSGDHSMPRRA